MVRKRNQAPWLFILIGMIVSHEHKFIFIKSMKTGGTSIEAALSQLCGPDDIVTPYRAESEADRQGRGPQNYRFQHPLVPKQPLWRRLLGRPERYYHPSVGFYEHMPASRVRAYVGDQIWRSYFKFAFDRNPWDRQISWYFYKTKNHWLHTSFEQFMSNRRRAYVFNFEIYGGATGVEVDYLGHYEDLDHEVRGILDHLGIRQVIRLPHTNRTQTRDHSINYKNYYTPITRDLVANWYSREIEALDYCF
jgi:hypothetical protein